MCDHFLVTVAISKLFLNYITVANSMQKRHSKVTWMTVSNRLVYTLC